MREIFPEEYLQLIGWDIPTSVNRAYYVCPFCGDGPIGSCGPGTSKRKLNINLQKGGQWRCVKCDEKGNLLTLASRMLNKSNEEVIKMVAKNEVAEIITTNHNQSDIEAEVKIDNDKCIAVYSKLLQILSLSEKHEEDLLIRGFSSEDIKKLGYKSLTTSMLEYENMKTLVARMNLTDKESLGVPAVYKTKQSNLWLNLYIAGIVIPIRNIHGEVIRLDIRRNKEDLFDENGNRNDKPKYVHVTSNGKPSGTSFQAEVHFATDFVQGEAVLGDTVYITEGTIKSDLFHAITKMPCLGLLGVNNTKPLYSLLPILKERGVKNIKLAFDMDRTSNEKVGLATSSLEKMILNAGFNCYVMNWETEYVNEYGERVHFSPRDTFIIPCDRVFKKKKDIILLFNDLEKLGTSRVLFTFSSLNDVAESKKKYEFLKTTCAEHNISFELALYALRHKGIDDYVVAKHRDKYNL